MSRPKLLTKKEKALVDAMSPAETIDWCCDGYPDAVLMVDMQGEEFWRPIVNGVGVGDRCADYYEAKAQAAEQLARWLRRKVSTFPIGEGRTATEVAPGAFVVNDSQSIWAGPVPGGAVADA